MNSWSLWLSLCIAALVGCKRTNPNTIASSTPPDSFPFFQDITISRGLSAPTPSWPDGTFATPEVTPGGIALFDYDNDGRLDILQICHGPPGHFEETNYNRLFHQEPDGSFREIPDGGGIKNAGYGNGVAVGDYDNDGLPDVYVTAFGHNTLFHNNGNGTFTDVTKEAGLLTDKVIWSSSATWLDYDRDGFLDLLVVHFAEFDSSRVCPGEDGRREYCGPSQFQGMGVTLYHNNHDGTFTDVTQKAGLTYAGRGWGVVCADLSGQGGPDIYIANDEERQNLYVNRHDGTFVDEALPRGAAYNGAGNAEAGMGVAVGDIANDGRLALFVTHFRNEKNTLYVPTGPLDNVNYRDGSATAGMAAIDLPYTGWGCGFFDFDNDGNLDVAVVNGRVARGQVHPKADVARLGKFWSDYAEPNLLFRGDGKGHFTDATERGGDFTAHAENTRGLAFGDIDNDGRVDMVSTALDNTLHVYRNVTPTGNNHWLSVRAMTGKRDAIGARLELAGGGRKWVRLVLPGYSFCSSNDPRAHFGLGVIDRLETLRVIWPDGKQEFFAVPGVDRQLRVSQGAGHG